MLFSAETTPEDDKAMKMHARRNRAAIFALQAIEKNKGIPEDLNNTVQSEFGMDKKQADLAIEDAKRSLAQDPDTRILLGLGKLPLKDKHV